MVKFVTDTDRSQIYVGELRGEYISIGIVAGRCIGQLMILLDLKVSQLQESFREKCEVDDVAKTEVNMY